MAHARLDPVLKKTGQASLRSYKWGSYKTTLTVLPVRAVHSGGAAVPEGLVCAHQAAKRSLSGEISADSRYAEQGHSG